VSQDLARWTPAQYILGGQPVLNVDYGPQGAKASNIQFDYAVIVFKVPAAGPILTHGRLPVDISGIAPVQLPDEDFLVGRVSPFGIRSRLALPPVPRLCLASLGQGRFLPSAVARCAQSVGLPASHRPSRALRNAASSSLLSDV
jgi:hypothetical protein